MYMTQYFANMIINVFLIAVYTVMVFTPHYPCLTRGGTDITDTRAHAGHATGGTLPKASANAALCMALHGSAPWASTYVNTHA